MCHSFIGFSKSIVVSDKTLYPISPILIHFFARRASGSRAARPPQRRFFLFFLKTFFLKTFFLKTFFAKTFFAKTFFLKTFFAKIFFAKIFFLSLLIPLVCSAKQFSDLTQLPSSPISRVEFIYSIFLIPIPLSKPNPSYRYFINPLLVIPMYFVRSYKGDSFGRILW